MGLIPPKRIEVKSKTVKRELITGTQFDGFLFFN